LHRGWYKDRGERTVIIKKRHRHWDDLRNGPLTGAILIVGAASGEPGCPARSKGA
jgi:hypothetical protein